MKCFVKAAATAAVATVALVASASVLHKMDDGFVPEFKIIELPAEPPVPKPSCFEVAAARQGLDPAILKAIALRESSFNPNVVNKNRNGSYDLGLMQINTIHVPELNKFGIHRRDLMKACMSIHVAAWLLKQKVKKYGPTWAAIGAYHSETPAERDLYAKQIKQDLKTIKTIKIQIAGL